MHADGRTAGARQGDTRYQAHDEDCHAGTLSKYLKKLPCCAVSNAHSLVGNSETTNSLIIKA